MGNKSTPIKILAILGVILVWFPLITPVVFGIGKLIRSGRFLVDFLMPAELFPMVLVGVTLLLYASFRARQYLKWIGWAFFIGVVLLTGGLVLAQVTGLDSSPFDPTGWKFILVTSLVIAFDLALVVVGVGGVLLVHTLFNRPQ